MMKRMIAFLLAAVVTTGGSSLLGREPVDETRKANPDARVMIENIAGSIRIRAWDRAEVRVLGVLGEDVERLVFRGDAEDLTIDVKIPRSIGRGLSDIGAELEIWLPPGSRIEAETVSASIEATGLAGRIDFASVSGQIALQGNPIEASLSTVSGRLRFDGTTDRMDAETVSGAIRLNGVSGTLDINSVSGRIEATASALDRASIESVSGSIELIADLAEGARLDLESHSADVTLVLPADTSASFELQTFSGHIDNELGPNGRRESRIGPGKSVEFTVGSGDARVAVETFSGNVKLRSR